MLTLVHGNRIERLADALAERQQQRVAEPVLTPERIVVQSKGMARWLTFRLAFSQGVVANVEFPFPATHIWHTFRSVLGADVPETTPYRPEALAWRILKALEQGIDRPAYEPLRRYLRDGDDLRRHELATRIADTYDGYLIYRPDWIRAWESGEGRDWQAELWRCLASEVGPHRVDLQDSLLRKLASGTVPEGAVPARLTVFGITTLPPSYTELLSALAELSDVCVFFLNPCRAYWGDIVSERTLEKVRREEAARAAYLEVGHPLLASWGRQGRDCLDQWLAVEPVEQSLFEVPAGDTLLARLQTDLLDLRWAESEFGNSEGSFVPDGSVQVHVCHSGMREVEVLQDQLLDMFAEDPDLDPGQVVVLTPDIDAYGPFIEAVFGSESGPRHIPFSIADRSARQDNATADAFLSLLEVLGSRFEADRVMALLDSPALRRCFGLSEEDREQLVDWVRDLGVRWGVDAEMRAAHGMPSTREHSWRFGLERLLLGFALPEGPRPEIFENILPDGRLDAGGAQVLGRFLRFFERLVTLQRVVSAGHPIVEWARHLQSALDGFFEGDGEHAPELQQIRDAISDLAACADEAGYGGIVPSEVVVRELESRLDRGRGAGRFLTGGVTFCAMVPMRSVPFDVVCLIGLNDAVYPRLDKRVDFDRLGHTWRRGDRSGREDDRYLFLEAILSARRRLYVSYVGASVRDNSAIPPSVLVAELLDTLDRRFGGRPGEMREAIQVRHPLQAFNPRYFIGDEPLFSYSAELCAAARARYEASGHPGWLVTEPLPARATSDPDVTLDELTRFLLNPTRHFLEARLGIRLTARDGALAQREPFVPTRSEWRQVQALIRGLDEADRDQSGSALARAAGLLPHGPAGELVYSESLRAVREFESRHLLLREAVLLPPEDFRLSIGDFVLSGRLESVGRQGLLRHSLKPCGAWDWLSLWVAHLCLNAAPPEGVLTESRLFCPDGCLTLNPVSEPLPVLGDLLALRARGDCEPIPFFPRAAKIYVDRCRSTRAAMPPLAKAESSWLGGDFARGESIDPHVDLLYRGISPIDQRFADVAMCVWTPLLECAEWQ